MQSEIRSRKRKKVDAVMKNFVFFDKPFFQQGIRVEALDYVMIVPLRWSEIVEQIQTNCIVDDKLSMVLKNVAGEWCDVYIPFPITDKLPIQDDFFGKGRE
jgi:hypothetical protein